MPRTGCFDTTTADYQIMLTTGRKYPQRTWAVKGSNGIGRHIAQRLVADGETVVDVPAKLSARVRIFDTGQGRKTDPIDAHSVAVAALRAHGLRRVAEDDTTVALRLLIDRRDQLGRTRTDTVNRLYVVLLDLIPGGAKHDLSARQARALLDQVDPVGVVAQTRHRLAHDLVEVIETVDAKTKDADRQRFATRGHFASWNAHRVPGCLLRQPRPPPALPLRQPPDQPGPAHHGHRPTPQQHRGPPLLRPPRRRGQDHHGSPARVEAPPV